VLTACNSSPIATTSLLVYMLLKDLHPDVYSADGWRAVVGVYGGELEINLPIGRLVSLHRSGS
jgi:hypothetical protein